MIRLKHILWYVNNIFAFVIFNLIKNSFKDEITQKRGILFINTGTLGDAVISSMMIDLQNSFENLDPIFIIVRKEYEDLFSGYSRNASFIFWDRIKYKWSISNRLSFIKNVRDLNADLCVNLTSARGISSDEIALLCGADKIWCFGNGWKSLKKAFGNKMDSYYDEILFGDAFNEYERHKKLIALLSGKDNSDNVNVQFNFSGTISEDIKEYMNEKYIVVAPCSSDRKRTWSKENYKLLCSALAEKYNVILLGTAEERAEIEKIASKNPKIKNLAGIAGLNEIPSLIKNASLFVGNDSGLSHIAFKAGTPMIAIIGGGNFNRYFPYMENKKRIFFYNTLECFNCEWECRFNERFCLTQVKFDDVFNSSMKLLDLK